MIHPATELRPVARASIGFGVFATAFIPAGTVTWVRDSLDQAIAGKAVKSMPELLRGALKRYGYRERDGSVVLCWDHARFNNHSCRPACRTVGDFDIAVRDIARGGELTIEYGVINVFDELECSCGEAMCRRTIRGSDVEQLGDRWDAEIREAARRSGGVEQPLATLFPANSVVMRMVASAASGGEPILPRCRDLVIGIRA